MPKSVSFPLTLWIWYMRCKIHKIYKFFSYCRYIKQLSGNTLYIELTPCPTPWFFLHFIVLLTMMVATEGELWEGCYENHISIWIKYKDFVFLKHCNILVKLKCLEYSTKKRLRGCQKICSLQTAKREIVMLFLVLLRELVYSTINVLE